jgi:hypothetical protein
VTGGAIIAMLVGLVIPALVALVTREGLPTWIKEAILLLLSTATGILTALVTNPPATLSDWEHVALNIIVAFLCAEGSQFAQTKLTTLKMIHRATDRFVGWGPRGEHVAAA